MDIKWLPVVGFEDFYHVSDAGQVKSLRRNILLRPSFSNSGGYPLVILSNGTGGKGKYVHHLVLEAFSGLRPPGTEARHLDGDASNAALHDQEGNLRLIWGTSSKNKFDEVRHGTHYEASRAHCESGHEWTKENTRIESYPDGTFKARRCRECARLGSADLRKKRAKDERRCKEEDCNKPYFGREWCSMHYGRWYRLNKMKSAS